MSELSPVYSIASDFVDRYAALDPIGATGMGVAGHDHEMTDFSPEGITAEERLLRSTLASLDEAPVADERDRICRDAMAESIGASLKRIDAGEPFRRLSIIRSNARTIRSSFDLMPRATVEEWRSIAARLSAVPDGIAGTERTLAEGVRRGVVAARRQVEANIQQAEAWAGMAQGQGSFFAELAGAFTATGIDEPTLGADLERGAAAAAAAYAGFAGFLRERYYDSSSEGDAAGKDLYAIESEAMNGIDLDLDETYSWGWEELYRVEGEMRKTCAAILPGATVAETIAYLEADPGRAIEGEAAFQRWMQDLQDRTIAELDGTHFEIAEPLRRIEAMIAPPGGALAMYYTGPSEDFTRPGRTWYPTGGKTRFPLWGEVSIAYHEGVPGHHLQIGTTKHLADSLSRFQRLMGGTSGYVEGWALYAERLMGELGYLEVPDYYLGMLRAQALRSVRVILDIGIHLELPIPEAEAFYGGETWTAELADAFARERSCFPPEFMASEVTRYLGTPGQAISYKVGERVWMQARAAAREAAGNAFDLKQWHKRALDLGPMGLGQMERELSLV
ncbi:MAG: DUF885 domain-containing protein [Dehalococcoidia bacterium]